MLQKHRVCSYCHHGPKEHVMDDSNAEKKFLSQQCDLLYDDHHFSCLECQQTKLSDYLHNK